MGNLVSTQENSRIIELMNEVLRGEWKIDKRTNFSPAFEKETQAMYFSNARKNLQSDVNAEIMNYRQDLTELKLLKGYKIDGEC